MAQKYIMQGGRLVPIANSYILQNGVLREIYIDSPDFGTVGPPVEPPPPPTGQPNFTTQNSRIELSNKNGVLIENMKWDGIRDVCIRLKNCSNVVIRNCWFSNTVSQTEIDEIQASYVAAGYGGLATATYFRRLDTYAGYGANTRLAIFADGGGANFLIENCYFENVESGAYLIGINGPIVFRNNEIKNVQGPFPRGQMIQLNSCNGGGVRIEYNYMVSERTKSAPEDLVNLYKCQGLLTDYMRVQYNYFTGHGPSNSGTTGILADGGHPSKYQIFTNNVSVNTNGCAIAGGSYCNLESNILFNSGTDRSNVGIAVANFYLPTGACSNHRVANNRVNWTNKNNANNPFWLGGGTYPSCSAVELTGNNWLDTSLNVNAPAPVGAGIKAWSGPLTTS